MSSQSSQRKQASSQRYMVLMLVYFLPSRAWREAAEATARKHAEWSMGDNGAEFSAGEANPLR